MFSKYNKPMRGNTAKRIISETSEETRAKASDYAKTLINKPMTAKEKRSIIQKAKQLQNDILSLPIYEAETDSTYEAVKCLNSYIKKIESL